MNDLRRYQLIIAILLVLVFVHAYVRLGPGQLDQCDVEAIDRARVGVYRTNRWKWTREGLQTVGGSMSMSDSPPPTDYRQ